ncbi:MAG: GntR family transcriptional regulator [Bacillota bacterium]|nr:GntR family transcriptional regulator [Bacillota bacterium]
MSWNFDSSSPIYRQIMTQLEFQMVSGKRKAGERLPSVRELAAEANVNPNTMQKALQELEREGYLITDRTNGRYVTDDERILREFKGKHIDILISELIAKLLDFGLTKEEIVGRITNHSLFAEQRIQNKTKERV